MEPRGGEIIYTSWSDDTPSSGFFAAEDLATMPDNALDTDGTEHLENDQRPEPGYDWLQVDEPDNIRKPVAPAEHTPPIMQRIADTPVGVLTIIRQDTDLVPYTAGDLAELLASTDDLRSLEQVSPHAYDGDNLGVIPDNHELILRWNRFGPKCGPEQNLLTPTAVANRMRTFEGEIGRLQQLGIRMLDRTVILVENDRHHDNTPVVYTVVPRHTTSEVLRTPLQEIDCRSLSKITTDVDTHLDLAGILATYYGETPRGGDHIIDGLPTPTQFATDGTWLDYDTRTRREDVSKIYHLELVEQWTRRLPASSARQEIIEYIESIPWRRTPWALSRLD